MQNYDELLRLERSGYIHPELIRRWKAKGYADPIATARQLRLVAKWKRICLIIFVPFFLGLIGLGTISILIEREMIMSLAAAAAIMFVSGIGVLFAGKLLPEPSDVDSMIFFKKLIESMIEHKMLGKMISYEGISNMNLSDIQMHARNVLCELACRSTFSQNGHASRFETQFEYVQALGILEPEETPDLIRGLAKTPRFESNPSS